MQFSQTILQAPFNIQNSEHFKTTNLTVVAFRHTADNFKLQVGIFSKNLTFADIKIR